MHEKAPARHVSVSPPPQIDRYFSPVEFVFVFNVTNFRKLSFRRIISSFVPFPLSERIDVPQKKKRKRGIPLLSSDFLSSFSRRILSRLQSFTDFRYFLFFRQEALLSAYGLAYPVPLCQYGKRKRLVHAANYRSCSHTWSISVSSLLYLLKITI